MPTNNDFSIEIPIKNDHPATNGHFVGHPILPGVVTLSQVGRAFKKLFPEKDFGGFKKVKFTHALTPGQVLSITFLSGPTKFCCRDNMGNIIASGEMG